MPERWALNCSYDKISENRTLLQIEGTRPVFTLSHADGDITIRILFDFSEVPLVLTGYLRSGCVGKTNICVVYTGSRIELYIDGMLCDEEWPIGCPLFENSVCAILDGEARFCDERELVLMPLKQPTITGLDGWRPGGHNTGAGDCMPFFHDGVYHLFYLFDRRSHNSKWGLGAHQWAHISSTDLVNWESHPFAITVDDQYEGSICTGSVIHHKGVFYAFYSVRMSDKSPAKLTYSTSANCIHFTKSHQYFTLPEPYENVSARDPFVFWGEDGQFHMLVTTSVNDPQNGRSRGALAHLTSPNLTAWRPELPFHLSKTAEQPECADYFSYNGYYYLVYSECGIARYSVSKEPFKGFIAPKKNIVGHKAYRVPKRDFFDGRIIFAGFTVTPPSWYGGTLHLMEAFQNADGTLEFKLVK